MHWLRLIRWQNLVIVFLTQFLAWACVMLPIQSYSDQALLLNLNNFFLLSLSTIFIAAAGYIINDYFDIKIDIINRPEKVILEKRIPLKMAIIAHSALNVAGIAIATYLAIKAGHLSFVALHAGCTIMLWFYSTHFKKQFITGNVAVSLLTSFTIIVLIVYEPAMHYFATQPVFIPTTGNKIPNPVWVLGIYTCFAFTLTWMREIVKDMEDFIGDAQEGCITMPIRWGLLKSARFTQAIGLLTLIPLITGAVKLLLAGWVILGIYTIVALTIPVIGLMIYLPLKATTKHYHICSRWLKLTMVAGIGSLIIYYFQAHA